MDQDSTDGTATDKRSWRERLGMGAREMPKISGEFKNQPAQEPSAANGKSAASEPVRPSQQAVTRPAPMAPRSAGATRPAIPAQRSAATAEAQPGTDSLADKLRAQRAAAEKLAEQRVNAAREKAEAKSAAQTAFPPSRQPQREAARGPVAERPRYSFAEGDGLPQRREIPAGNGSLRPPPPLVPPRPALGQDRGQPAFTRQPPPSYRQDPIPPYRPIDPATGYTQPPRQPQMPPSRSYGADYGGRGYGSEVAPRSYQAEPLQRASYGSEYSPPPAADYGARGRAGGYDSGRRGYDPESRYDQQPAYGEDPRFQQRSAPRGLGRPGGIPASGMEDEIFEDQAPRRRASASDYQSAYRGGEAPYGEERRRSNGPWLLLLALVAAAVVTGSVIIFFSGGKGGNELATGKPAEGEIPVVTAPETPAKTATEPVEDASAGAASARKKQIYDRIVGDQEVQGDSQVVPTEVTPVEPQSSTQSGDEDPALELPPADATGVGGEDIPLPLPPPPEDDPGTQGSLGSGDSQQLAASGPPESQGTGSQAGDPSLALLPPDGGNAGAANTTQATPPSTEQPADATSEAATTPPAAPAEEEPAAPPPKKTTTKKKATTQETEVATLEESAAVPPSQQVSPSQDGTAATTPPAETAPLPPKKKKTLLDLLGASSSPSQQDASAATTTTTQKVATAPSTGTTTSTTTSVPAGKYVAQLTSFRTEADAQAEYGRLKTKYPGIIGNLPPVVSKSTLAGSTRYRLSLGPIATRDQATQVCNALFKAGERDCLVRGR